MTKTDCGLAVSKMLRKKGFPSSATATRRRTRLRSRKDEIDVILLDMTLPGMSSHEVIAEAQRIRPDVKVILTTAYSREMAAPSFAAPQVKAFIRKPISNQRSDEPAAGNSIRVRLM